MSSNRYVPPHLRGRANSNAGRSSTNSNSSNTSKNNSVNTNTNSRWRDFGEADRKNNDQQGYSRYNSHHNQNRNAAATPPVVAPGASRWANVDRSSIESRTASSSSYNRNHPHRSNNNNYRNHNQHDRVKAIFFGDSFIKLFALLNDYTDDAKVTRRIEVHKYKAASAKGLCRDGNENRSGIFRVVDRLSRYSNLERLVFCFGDVDVHMSYYYKKYVKGAPLSNEDLEQIAHEYVDFIAGLEVSEGLKKLVVGIYPSPLMDSDVGSSLKAYGSLETDNQVSSVDASEDCKMVVRQARVDLYNQALRDRIEYHNSSITNATAAVLEYHDVQDELLTTSPENDNLLVVRDAYRDVSDLNIHLIHETTLQLWVEKWPWYKELTEIDEDNSNNNNKMGFVEYLQKTFDDYRKTKPWAERKHVAETMGVQLS